MKILSGGHRSIDEWCYAYDEVDLGLILGVIQCFALGDWMVDKFYD